MPSPLSDTHAPHEVSQDEWSLMDLLCARAELDPLHVGRPSQWGAVRVRALLAALDRIAVLEVRVALLERGGESDQRG